MPVIQNSIISFPNRGPWGDQKFRGNTSGHVVMGFLERWHSDKTALFVDPMQGSGTSGDVAKEMGIRYKGFDLSTGFNILKDDLLTAIGEQPLTAFLHPPYKDMIKYSDSPEDLSNFSNLDDFLEMSYVALMNVYRALRTSGVYAVLMGNMRKNGEFMPLGSMYEAMAPGKQIEQIIKIQNNVSSMRNNFYGNSSFVPIMHEILMVFRKPDTMIMALDVVLKKAEQLNRMSETTWRSLIKLTMMQSNGTMTLSELYEAIEGTPKAKANPNWQAKIRQIVQGPEFRRIQPGTYQLGLIQ